MSDQAVERLLEHPQVCLACGPSNPASLGLRRSAEGDVVCGSLALDARHAGVPGYAHGGLLALILDDVMGSVPALHGYLAVTGNLDITFRAPARLGTELTLRAHLVGKEGRRLTLAGRVRDEDGLVAEATGIWVVVPVAHFGSAVSEAG